MNRNDTQLEVLDGLFHIDLGLHGLHSVFTCFSFQFPLCFSRSRIFIPALFPKPLRLWERDVVMLVHDEGRAP